MEKKVLRFFYHITVDYGVCFSMPFILLQQQQQQHHRFEHMHHGCVVSHNQSTITIKFLTERKRNESLFLLSKFFSFMTIVWL